MTNLRLRPEEPADAAAIRRVLVEAFARRDTSVPAEVALVEALRGGEAWLPELSMVAEADGRIVGYALLSRVWVEPGAVPALALGPVAVRPSLNGRGFGTAMVRAVLDAAAELGERLVVVLGNPAFYRRFGFVPAVRFNLTSPWSGLGAPWQALVLPSPSDGYDSSGLASPGGAPAGAKAALTSRHDTKQSTEPVPAGEVIYPPPWSQV